MFVCLFMCLLLPSSFFSAVCAQNEPPTIQKQRADGGFFICLKDYIMWFSVRCVHIHAHTNLVADGGRCHTCTHHTLTVSLVLTQTRFEHVQTDKYRRTQAHTLQWQPPTPPVDGKLDPQVPEGRETEKEFSGPSDVCVIYTPTPSSFFLSDPTFPQFQAANSAVCQVHFQSLECTCKHSSHLYLLRSLSDTRPVHLCSHTSHLRNDTWKLFVTSYKLKHQTHEDTLNEASPSQQSHLLRAKLYINMSCRITRWLWKCHLKNASSHKDIRTVLNTHSEMKYSTWWSIKTGSRPFWLVQHFVCTLYTCTALPFSSGPYCPHSVVLFVYFV